MSTATSMIALEDVTFKYKSDQLPALDQVSFSIPKGQWTCIVGHNGSGKSTIAKLMVGIERPTEGYITLNGERINDDQLSTLNDHIGIVFQNPENQFVGSTVENDVAFGLENRAVPYEDMHEIVWQALEQVGMTAYISHEPSALSGGQKQRVAIAGVLALNTDVIILDEATSMLDPEGRNALLQLIRELNREKEVTIISITHDLSEALEADHIVVLDQGHVFKTGTPETIFEDATALANIGLDLPFSMRVHQMLGYSNTYITYEGLIQEL